MDGNALEPETGIDASPPNPKSARTRLFDEPLFADPSARALSHVGVIDVGSNSVRLVVFDGAARSPAYFFNEKVLCGLGKGLAETGLLNPEGRVRAEATLLRFSALTRSLSMTNLTMVATAAMREATDGPEFQAMIEAKTGLKMRIIDGAEEARLSAQGVLTGWPEAEGLVCDIGGNSMELAVIGGGQVHQTVSSPLGPFRLQNIAGGKKGLRTHIGGILKGLRDDIGEHHDALYLVGGSWRAVARLDMERRNYPLKVLHEYAMTPKNIRKTLAWIAAQDMATLKARTGISGERMALVPLAAQVLRQLVHVFGPRRVYVSSYGVREGILYEQMPERLRARDPLLEACHFMEYSSARLPGLGRKLYDFLLPLYRNRPPERLRLILAACLLHDVNWRAHPDYRADACFDTTTRANLGGLDHAGRVYLGVALMYRYKTGNLRARMKEVTGLLSDADVAEAKMLGRALRFGSMFALDGPENAGELRYYPKKGILELVLERDMQALYSEVAEQRFIALAQEIGAEPKVRVRRTYNSNGVSTGPSPGGPSGAGGVG